MPSITTLSFSTESLYMVWPQTQETTPPVTVPPVYRLRYFQDEDAQAYCALVNLDGWRDARWSCTPYTLRHMVERALPKGFFLVEHSATGALVATATARHRPDADSYYFPYGGEICLVFVHPDHRRLGLGRAVTAAALGRLLEVGYSNIYFNVMDERFPALRMYQQMGFLPLLYTEAVAARWQTICTRLHWPFTPEAWPQTIPGAEQDDSI